MRSSAFTHKIIMLGSGLGLALVSIVSLSFSFVSKTSTIWNQLGISENTGVKNIKMSFLEGYVYSYGASAAKKVAMGERVALTNEVLGYCKEYVNSPGFKKEYHIAREKSRPTMPEALKSKEQIQRERIASFQKSLEEGEKSLKTLPADLIGPFQEVQQMLRDQIKDYQDPESPMLNMLVDAEKFNYNNKMHQYEADVKSWLNNFPEDPKQMVKARLQKFMDVTKDVDFSASLKEEYRLKKFVNPSYEKKSDEWKMAFRSGKPVVDAARTFTTQWLTELE